VTLFPGHNLWGLHPPFQQLPVPENGMFRRWKRSLFKIIPRLAAAFFSDYLVIGGGGTKLLFKIATRRATRVKFFGLSRWRLFITVSP